MSYSKRKGDIPHLNIVTNSTTDSLSTISNASDQIRPLLSPIVSEPDETPSIKQHLHDKMLLSPGDADDDLLLRSLKFASMSNTNLLSSYNNLSKYKSNSRLSLISSKSSLKQYKDDPTSSTDPTSLESPYIFQPNNSKIIRSNVSFQIQHQSHIVLPETHEEDSDDIEYNHIDEPNGINSHGCPSIAESIIEEATYLRDLTISQIKRRRFFAISIFSIFCIFIFNLIFLPRTSLDRDLRRLYGGSLTFDDISRIYLNQLHYNSKINNYLLHYNENTHFTGKNHKFIENYAETFEYLGINTEKYEVYMGSPIDTRIQLFNEKTKKIIFEPNLKESDTVSYIPYSKSGTIEGNYVYVNYGTIDDYNTLKENNIKIENNIFIIRYNKGTHLSLIVENAIKNGAIGIITYNDPFDDGKFTEKNGYMNFPLGYSRNHHEVDKFTSNYIYYQPGDPTTPGWSPYLFQDHKRLKNPKTIPNIPILPISFTEIEPLLTKVNGLGPNLNWVGNLENFKYTPGPSVDYSIKLINEIDYGVKPIYNIILEIPGIITDEEIIIGTSRDVISGLGGLSNGEVGLFEIARGFNELTKLNWKPLRTIKLISWDGSNHGQLGSTEYGEYYAQRLINNCFVYINFDNIRGNKLSINSNPLFNNVLKKVMDLILINNNESLLDNFEYNNNTIDMISEEVNDYTIFQNHLGIPSINIGFKQDKNTDPVSYYNSNFDNLEFLKSFDPDLKLHNLLSQFIGMLVIELSEHEIINVSTNDYLQVISTSLNKLYDRVPKEWLEKPMKYPFDYQKLEDEMKKLNNTVQNVLELTKIFDKEMKSLQEEIIQDYPWFKLLNKIKTAIKIKMYNSKIKSLDKMFVTVFKDTEQSLSVIRPWYRHLIFAPSLHSSNSDSNSSRVDILPGLIEALTSGNFELFELNLISLDDTINRIALTLS